MTSSARQSFDPGDAFDAMADSFRVQTVDLLLQARKAAIFSDLPPASQIECFVAGVMTGLVGSCFACITDDGHDEMMTVIADYLPLARQNAEETTEAAR